jgi:hypothetical protein
VPGKEILGFMAGEGPQRPGDADAFIRQTGMRLPILQQFIQDRVEFFLRRVPGFHQVIVQPHFVDGVDRRLGIGVGGEQDAFGLRIDLDGLHQKFHSSHLRHALVNQKQRHGLIALLQSCQVVQGGPAAVDRDDAVFLSIMGPQVALDGVQHRAVIIQGEDHGFCHGCILSFNDTRKWACYRQEGTVPRKSHHFSVYFNPLTKQPLPHTIDSQ